MLEPDERGRPGILTPELNPLLNPVLHRNLERWAEVYFANPPEKRDEAVMRLLRELENENRSGDRLGSSTSVASSDDRLRENRSESIQGKRVLCEVCGFLARPNQRFCGRCGARLLTPLADALAHEEAERNRPAMEASVQESSFEDRRIFPNLQADRHEVSTADEPIGAEPRFSLYAEESESVWRSYRPYLGAAIAILLGALGYLAWRGAQTNSGIANLPQQAPAAENANPPSEKANAPAGNPSQAQSNQSNQVQPAPANSQSQTASNPPSQGPGNAASLTPARVVTSSNGATAAEAAAGGGNGAEEFGMAHNLLSAPTGQRDSSQAAEWLWKSVEKKNTGAMVTLADLYLRGDGVQKNCEQGRVLLDAAAKKGRKDAAEMLRSLPAFGCE